MNLNFLCWTTPVNDTYKNSKILKFQNYISLQNTLLVKDCFDDKLSKPLTNCFKKKKIAKRLYLNRFASKNYVFVAEFVLILMLKTQSNTNLHIIVHRSHHLYCYQSNIEYCHQCNCLDKNGWWLKTGPPRKCSIIMDLTWSTFPKVHLFPSTKTTIHINTWFAVFEIASHSL